MDNLKYLASQISEKLNYWEETAKTYKNQGYVCDWEKGHVDAYASCLELIEDLIAC